MLLERGCISADKLVAEFVRRIIVYQSINYFTKNLQQINIVRLYFVLYPVSVDITFKIFIYIKYIYIYIYILK